MIVANYPFIIDSLGFSTQTTPQYILTHLTSFVPSILIPHDAMHELAIIIWFVCLAIISNGNASHMYDLRRRAEPQTLLPAVVMQSFF